MRGSHFKQGKQKAETRFCALVLVYAIGMQAVAATAGLWIVELLLQHVFSKKPIEGGSRVLRPSYVSTNGVGFKAGRNGRASFNGLLIKSRLRTASDIKTIGADRSEIAVR